MAKFKVRVTQTVVEETYVEVEAGDESEAEKIAVDQLNRNPGNYEWEYVGTTDDDYSATATDIAEYSDASQ